MPKYSIRRTTHYECDTCGLVRPVFSVSGWALIRPLVDVRANSADLYNTETFTCHCPWCRKRLTELEGRDPEDMVRVPMSLPSNVRCPECGGPHAAAQCDAEDGF